MKRHLTLRNLISLIGHVQLVVLWVWGLWAWTVGTLIVSTLLIAVQLEFEERRTKR